MSRLTHHNLEPKSKIKSFTWSRRILKYTNEEAYRWDGFLIYVIENNWQTGTQLAQFFGKCPWRCLCFGQWSKNTLEEWRPAGTCASQDRCETKTTTWRNPTKHHINAHMSRNHICEQNRLLLQLPMWILWKFLHIQHVVKSAHESSSPIEYLF